MTRAQIELLKLFLYHSNGWVEMKTRHMKKTAQALLGPGLILEDHLNPGYYRLVGKEELKEWYKYAEWEKGDKDGW